MIIRWIQTYALFIVGGVAAFFAFAFGMQTIKLEGLKIWPLEIEGCKVANVRLLNLVENMKNASAEAGRLAEADLAAQELRHKENKEFTDARLVEIKLESADHLAGFILANRMRPEAGGGISRPAASSGTDSNTGGALQANSADIMDGSGFVAVPASDLLICQSYFDRLLAAQEWAVEVNE